MPKVWNKRDLNVPKDAVYVGRPTKYGNPFRMRANGDHAERLRAVSAYHKVVAWLAMPTVEKPGTLSPPDEWINSPANSLTYEDIMSLRGKDLVCWCAPKSCHADVLLEIANARP